ncbi:MAG TPA: ParB/RepB/Spo0J family partition protein [Thermomicrobiales bacterium]|nr:ParB/RepB/Spo0J family partition protein [Thermomicrobiales bacterium]
MSDDTKRSGRSRRRFTVDALFSDTRPQATGVTDLANAKEIELTRIEPDPEQPRRTFDDERLEELRDSILAEGVLQPIVVRYDESRDIYVIVHGERRWRASRLASQKTIPALVREVPAERRLIQQLMENVVRDDLNAIDRAAALRTLREQLGDAPWEQVAEAVGIRRSRLFQLLGTEKLPEQAKIDIQTGRLSEKQSRALQGLPASRQDALRELIVERNMPAATATRLAKAFRDRPIVAEHDPAAVRQALHDLYGLVAPDDPDDVRRQTDTVLDAVRKAEATGMATLIAAPKFNSDRLVKEISALARSLTRLDRQTLATSPETSATLRTLRDALNTVLDEDD